MGDATCGTDDRKEAAALALSEYMARGGDIEAVVAAGAIGALVALVHSGTSGAKAEAAKALERLAADDVVRERVVEAGALEVLLAAVRSSTKADEFVGYCAAGAVGALSGSAAVRYPLGADVYACVVALHSGPGVAAAEAVRTLRILVPYVEPGQVALADNTEAVIALLRTDAAAEAAEALQEMANYCREYDSLELDGAIAPLMDVLRFGAEPAREHAAGALHALADRYGPAVVRAGGIAALVACMRTGAQDGETFVRSAAAGALGLIAGGFEADVIAEGGVDVLVDLLQFDCESADLLRCMVACALRRLARHQLARRRIVEAGALPPLVAMLSHGPTAEEAADALAGLIAGDVGAAKSAVAAGAVPQLVALASTGRGMEPRKAAVTALGRLADCVDAAQGPLSGLVASLVEALNSDPQAVSVLRVLVKEGWTCAAMAVAAGAVPRLITLATCGPDGTRSEAGRLLGRLAASGPQHSEAGVTGGAVDVLSSMVQEGDAEEKLVGVATLADLAGDVDLASGALVKAVDALVKFLESGAQSEAAAAAFAMNNLMTSPSATSATSCYKMMFLEAGAVNALIAFLASGAGDALPDALWALGILLDKTPRAALNALKDAPLSVHAVLLVVEAALKSDCVTTAPAAECVLKGLAAGVWLLLEDGEGGDGFILL